MDKNANGIAQAGYRVMVSVAILVPESVNYFRFFISNFKLPYSLLAIPIFSPHHSIDTFTY